MSKEFEPRKETLLTMVSAIIKNPDDRVLLLKRSSSNKTFQRLWQLPEGKIEPEESPEEALARELKEEIGFRVSQMQLLGAGTERFSVNDKNYLAIRLAFEVKGSGEIKLSEDHDEYGWLSRAECWDRADSLLPGTSEILYKYYMR